MAVKNVSTVAKAFQLIEYMAGEKVWYGVSELAESLGMYKSNIHNLLATCENFGYVEQDAETKKYALSMKFVQLSHHVRQRFGFNDMLGTILRKLSEETGELSYFASLYKDKVLYLCGAFPSSAIAAKPVVGLTLSPHCDVMGKVLMAYANEEVLGRICNEELKKYTATTITDPDDLRIEIQHVRENGYAVDHMEYEYGIKGIAVPVINSVHGLLGAVCLKGPAPRFPDSINSEYAEKLRKVAEQISERWHQTA